MKMICILKLLINRSNRSIGQRIITEGNDKEKKFNASPRKEIKELCSITCKIYDLNCR